jgi:Tfp pilus assembly protein PilE
MVVVTIIGVLMAAGIIAFTNAMVGARDAARIADVNAIAKMLEQYYMDNGQYYSNQANSGGANWTAVLEVTLSPYLGGRKLQIDPKNTGAFVYALRSADRATTGDGSTKFCIFAKPENTVRANCTAPGVGVYDCTYTNVNPTHYCVSSRQ